MWREGAGKGVVEGFLLWSCGKFETFSTLKFDDETKSQIYKNAKDPHG